MSRFLFVVAALVAFSVPAILPSTEKVSPAVAVVTPDAQIDAPAVENRVIVDDKLTAALPENFEITPDDYDISEEDYVCLALAVYFEARSEPIAGQKAVAEVVLNRVQDKRFPDSVCAVVFQNEKWRHRCQFSFACDGRSDRPRERRPWAQARKVAAVVIAGISKEMTSTATHYHATYVRPSWAKRLERTVQVGRHVFYR